MKEQCVRQYGILALVLVALAGCGGGSDSSTSTTTTSTAASATTTTTAANHHHDGSWSDHHHGGRDHHHGCGDHHDHGRNHHHHRKHDQHDIVADIVGHGEILGIASQCKRVGEGTPKQHSQSGRRDYATRHSGVDQRVAGWCPYRQLHWVGQRQRHLQRHFHGQRPSRRRIRDLQLQRLRHDVEHRDKHAQRHRDGNL